MNKNDTVKIVGEDATFCGENLKDKVGTVYATDNGTLFPLVVEIDGIRLLFREDEVERIEDSV